MPTSCCTSSTRRRPIAIAGCNAVQSVLDEVGAIDVPMLEVYNKCDALTPDERRRLQDQDPAALCISALERQGIDELIETIASRLALDVRRVTLTFDPDDAADRERIARVYRHARVVLHETRDGQVSIVADVPRRLLEPARRDVRSSVRCDVGSNVFADATSCSAGRRSLLLVSACAPKTGAGAGRHGAEVSRFHAAGGARRVCRARAAAIERVARLGVSAGRRFEERRARVCRGAEGDAGVLSGRNLARLRRAGAQGCEGGAAAFRPRAGAAARSTTMCRRWSAADRRCSALNREADALAAFEAALAVDPSLTDLARRVEVLKFRSVGAGTCAGARRRRGPAGSTRRCRPTRRRSPARPTARSCIASWPAVERQQGACRRRARALPQGGRARSERRALARADRRDPRSARRLRGRGEGVRRRRWRSSRTPACEARLEAVRAPRGAGAAAGGVPRDRPGAADHARRSRGARSASGSRRCCRAAPRERRGADHRRAQQLGGDLDHGGGARRRHGAVREPRVPAADASCAASIWRRPSRGCCRASPRRRPAARKAWETARLKFSDLSPSHLAYPAASAAVASGVLTTGAGNSFQPSRPVTGAEAIDAIAKIEALAGRR